MKFWKFQLTSTLIVATCFLTFVKLNTTWLNQEETVHKHEAYYIEKLTNQLDGQKEVHIQGGRIDILTSEHAIEVEWAPKWKEAIGQALWYAMQKNSKPKIILLMKKKSDYKYFVMLNSAIANVNMEFETKYIELFEVRDDDAELILK